MGINYNTSIVRDGLAVYLDAANPKSYSVNVHSNPTDIFAWSGTGANQATLSRDNISSPVGITPLKMVVSGNDPYTATYNNSSWNLAPAASGQTWTVSFWVKASTATTGSVYIFGANSSGNYVEVPGTSYNISTDWQRVSYTGTLSNASTTNVQIRVGGPSTGGSGVSIWWDGLQLEKSSSMSNFNPMTNTNNSSWKDISGNGYHSTLTNGPTFSSSSGGTIVFDGSNDYSTSITPTINWVTGGTCEMVFQSADITSRAQGYLTLNTGGQFVNFYSGGLSKIRWEVIRDAGITYTGGFNNNTTLSNNTWYHVTGTWTSSGVSTVYLNGVADGSVQITGTNWPNASTSAPLVLGNYAGYANAKIPLVRVYNRTLTASEVKQNFESVRDRYGI